MLGTTPNSSSMSSVGGWKVEPRSSITSSGSAASTTVGILRRASASAAVSPTGPAPTTMTRSRLVCTVYCGLMPAALTDSAKFSRSFLKTAAVSSLVSPPGTIPSLIRRSCNLRRLHQRRDLLADRCDDLVGRAGRDRKAVPRGELETGEVLGDGREVRCGRDALRGTDRDQTDLCRSRCEAAARTRCRNRNRPARK